ncbi:MAG: hypothetical protein JRE82_17270 [Deltaproteobacteria bacterium]|nr:hypothetical protein [Deltaproteobacteria bacterium]
MRYLFGFVCVCALGAVPLVGCGDTAGGGGSGGAAGSGGTGGAGGAAGMGGGGTGGDGGAAGAKVALSVSVTEAEGVSPTVRGPAFEGVELCETDTTNCATTDADGRAEIMVSANQEISYTLKKDGYAPFLVGDVADETLLRSLWPMFSDAMLADAAEAVEIPYPLTGGILGLQVLPSMAGVTFDLLDETGIQYYADEAGIDTLGLTATTTIGSGGFYEVSSGEPQVEFGGTATNCTPSIAWPGDAANRIKVPVRVGYVSYGSMVCDAP